MKKLLIILLFIVGCAPTKPPIATFYIGMTEKEFLELNQNKTITENPMDRISKKVNMSQFIDGDEPTGNVYVDTFKNDTLILVYCNNMRDIIKMLLGKQIDYDKYATPPE